MWYRADADIHGFGSDPLLSANRPEIHMACKTVNVFWGPLAACEHPDKRAAALVSSQRPWAAYPACCMPLFGAGEQGG